jgi:hypothetical protein
MLSTIKALFGIAKDSSAIIGNMKEEKMKTKGRVNRILNEIEFNMKLVLEHYMKKGVDSKIVIEKLRIKHLAKAIDDGFEFENIKRGRIDVNMIGDVGFFKHYVGYDCETLLKRIRFHIEQIKLLPQLYEKTNKIDIKARLENLGKRYILFTKFLQSKQ